MGLVGSVFGVQPPPVMDSYVAQQRNGTDTTTTHTVPMPQEEEQVKSIAPPPKEENRAGVMAKMVGVAGTTAAFAFSWMNHTDWVGSMMGSSIAQAISWGGPIVLGATCCYLAYKVWKQAGMTNNNTNTTTINLHVHVLPGQNPPNVVLQKHDPAVSHVVHSGG